MQTKDTGIALPLMCTLIDLWVSGAKTNSGIAITKLNHQRMREGLLSTLLLLANSRSFSIRRMLIFPLTFTKIPKSCKTLKRRAIRQPITLMMFPNFDFVSLQYAIYTLMASSRGSRQLFRYWVYAFQHTGYLVLQAISCIIRYRMRSDISPTLTYYNKLVQALNAFIEIRK